MLRTVPLVMLILLLIGAIPRWATARAGAIILVVQTRRLLPGRPASRLLRFARNDRVSACHCEEYSDEAISVKARTGGNHLSGLHH